MDDLENCIQVNERQNYELHFDGKTNPLAVVVTKLARVKWGHLSSLEKKW